MACTICFVAGNDNEGKNHKEVDICAKKNAMRRYSYATAKKYVKIYRFLSMRHGE